MGRRKSSKSLWLGWEWRARKGNSAAKEKTEYKICHCSGVLRLEDLIRFGGENWVKGHNLYVGWTAPPPRKLNYTWFDVLGPFWTRQKYIWTLDLFSTCQTM